MGNRSKFLAVGAAAAGGALVARRRARMRRVAEGIRDAILPTHVDDLSTDARPTADDAHAPGHQHMPMPDADERGPEPLPDRPWTKHAHGMRHPFGHS